LAQAAHITNALGLIVRMTAASRATCDVPRARENQLRG